MLCVRDFRCRGCEAESTTKYEDTSVERFGGSRDRRDNAEDEDREGRQWRRSRKMMMMRRRRRGKRRRRNRMMRRGGMSRRICNGRRRRSMKRTKARE